MLEIRPHKLFVRTLSGILTDENGNPQQPTETWEEAIPCHFETDSRQNIYHYCDGRAAEFEYVVWLEPISTDLTGQTVKLADEWGKTVTEKMVQKCVNGQLRTKLYL